MKNILIQLLIALSLFTLSSCGKGAMKEESFYVRGNCSMCKKRIESDVKKITGVAEVRYAVEGEQLKVTYDTTLATRTTIEQHCAALGHATEVHPMNKKNHDALPECCKVSTQEGKH
jgi:periplasmic mercuric ion binding protein